MEELLLSVGNYGFPMVLSAYLLIRVEKKLDDLTIAITKLGQVMRSDF